MRKKMIELDVDFIGEQEKSLTIKEELAISRFIEQLKEKPLKSSERKILKKEKQKI